MHISTRLPTLNPIPANSLVTLLQRERKVEREEISSMLVAGVIINIVIPVLPRTKLNSFQFARSQWMSMSGGRNGPARNYYYLAAMLCALQFRLFCRHSSGFPFPQVYHPFSIYFVAFCICPSLYHQFGCYSMGSETADWLGHQIQGS